MGNLGYLSRLLDQTAPLSGAHKGFGGLRDEGFRLPVALTSGR